MDSLKHMQNTFKNLMIIREILPFLWTKKEKVRRLFLISFGLIFVSIVLGLCIPLILKEIVSKLSLSDKDMTYQLTVLLVTYGVIWTLSQAIQQVRHIILVRPLERCIRLFCSKLFDHLHSLPVKFHLDRETGALTNALDRAQQGFSDVFWGVFLFVIPATIELFLAAGILFYFYGTSYAFILISISTVFILFTLYATEWTSHFQTLSNKQQSNTNAKIVDSLLNFTSVKHFNNKKYEVLKCENYLKLREKLLVRSISSMEFVRIGQSLIIGVGLVILTYTAGKQTLLNVYDVSDFVLINGYVLQFSAPLGHIGFIARNIRRGLNKIIDIMEIYNTKPATSRHAEKNSEKLEKFESVEFKKVSFGYNASHLVLKDVSFHLQAGKTVGIVGATGSGKSTISNLLFNFYKAKSGNIFVNNKDIQSIKTESLCNFLGIVPQDIMLFNTTIYENILFARPSSSKKEVDEVIQLTHLGPVLKKLPHYYETIVGERGIKLSGGEKQRIAIARVLLKRPSLYIFDEATSSLDHSTESIIMRNIAPILKDAASIIIAHRLSTVVNADEILVLDNGVIAERGTHMSLLKENGIYTTLWKTQKEAATSLTA